MGVEPQHMITAWWYTYPSEKYESQLGCLFPIYEKQVVPRHQADMIMNGLVQGKNIQDIIIVYTPKLMVVSCKFPFDQFREQYDDMQTTSSNQQYKTHVLMHRIPSTYTCFRLRCTFWSINLSRNVQ
jgi:hypothetical protein